MRQLTEQVNFQQFKEILNGGRVSSKATKKTCRSLPSQASNVERVARNGSNEANACTTFNTRVDITFVHYRYRLADPDGISCKAAIDGLVASKILGDDSHKEVNEVRQRQVKITQSQTEMVEIIIEEVMT